MKKITVLSIAFLSFVVLHGSLAAAQNIKVQNNTDVNIKSLECFSSQGMEPESLVLENLAAGSSVHIADAKFPENLCSRLVFTMENGKKWQIFTEHEVGSLDNFSMELSPISRHSKHTIPLYTAMAEDYIEQQVAGLPLFIFAQLIPNTPVENYNEWLTPGTKLENDTSDVLNFAGYHWNITENSLVLKDNKVKDIRFEVPFMITPANIAILAKDAYGASLELDKVIVDGKETMLESKGSDAINEAFMQCIDAKNCQLNFYSQSLSATLYLLDGQSMQLHVSSGIPAEIHEKRQSK